MAESLVPAYFVGLGEIIPHLRTLALHSVAKGTYEYHLRHIMRWYSEKFHTPLHMVEDLPLEDILSTFFECEYEDLDEEKLEYELHQALMSPEKLSRLRRQEDADEADMAEYAREAQVLEEKHASGLPGPVVPTPDPQQVPQFPEPKEALNTVLDPGIHMTFDDDFDMPAFGPDERE
jgi:hypothetical protein